MKLEKSPEYLHNIPIYQDVVGWSVGVIEGGDAGILFENRGDCNGLYVKNA